MKQKNENYFYKRYSKKFYNDMVGNDKVNNKSSARQIVPMILNLLQPESVVDFGCAIGLWLDAFKKSGNITRVLGIDGEWVDENDIVIEKDEFFKFNIENDITPKIKDKYDLVVCLEVAEHISKKNENTLINNLVSLGDVILFSAAVPNQGGDNHINEQKQSYWVNKFEKKGYILIDYLRPRIWDNKNVMYCYKQNMFIFVKENQINKYSFLKSEKEKNICYIKDIYHPDAFADCINSNQNNKYLFKMQLQLIKAFKYKISKYLFNFISK